MALYVPRHFSETDQAAIRRALDDYGFATLISVADREPMVSHVPILVEYASARPVAAIGHVAAANPHAALLGKASSLLVFQGPQGYVSPNWYTAPAQSVPTWNYVAVHLHGEIERLDALADKRSIVDALSARHEAPLPKPWTSNKMEPALLEKMLGAIVGFRMKIGRVDAKFKLSQNRSAADRASVIAALEAQDAAQNAAPAYAYRGTTAGVLAGWMRANAKDTKD